MRNIRISSELRGSFRKELERIVFFNPEQSLITGRLVDLVHRYGVPEIVEEDDRLRFRATTLGILQTLYAFDATEAQERLVGVAMFTRVRRSTIVVVHIAAHEDYTSRGKWSSEAVVVRLVTVIRKLAMRTRGVNDLQILYPHETRLDVRSAGKT